MSDYFDRVERQIVRNVEAGLPRATRMPTGLGYLAPAAAVAVVVLVAGVFLLARGSSPAPGPSAAHRVTITFTASAADPHAPLGHALDRSVVILRERLGSAVPGTRVEQAGNEIVVDAPNASSATRHQILALAVPGHLAFYDWEANAITPNGKTVASQLIPRNPTALELSQGSGSAAPGDPGAGGMSHRQAVALASRCKGCVVLQAVAPSVLLGPTVIGPSARFYVLKDVPFLSGAGITHPRQGIDASGMPNIEFGFTAAADFAAATKRVAERGDVVSAVGQTFNQHFAVALDGRLISVPSIDFKAYPDGIPQRSGADISGGFTHPVRQRSSDSPALRAAPGRPHSNGVNGYITTAAASTLAIHKMQTGRPGPIRLTRSATAT